MESKDLFLAIVRKGIGHQSSLPAQKQIDWNVIEPLAAEQGLLAILVDGVDNLPEEQRPPKQFLLQWIGDVIKNYEQRYLLYGKTIAEMAAFYNKHGLKMMVIKGYACGIDWPRPEHRPYGDIDIWQFGDYRKADALLSAEKGIEVDNSHHHHTVYQWGGFSVENHYDFNNVHHHRSSTELEKLFKELGKDESYTVEVCGEKVYLPSPNLHTLFLLKHSMTDFAAFYVTLRQVLDWGFHVKKHHNEIDWEWLKGVMEKFHMTEFFNTINAICVENLGFDASIFPYINFDKKLKEKVLLDILEPKFTREEPQELLPRLVYKYRRWKGNAWKHEMCYNESLWSAFWSGVWNHVTKPASI